MKKISLDKIDVEIYHEQLDNGLNVYLIPKDNVNNVYAVFATKYGSVHSEFIPINKTNMVKVPDGVAHYLEHKLFEQEDGENPFNFFKKTGADVNAYTNYFNTAYHFSGTERNEDNLNYLLDFVQSPYFTDENVEKEKGIIEQELKMYEDLPSSRIYDQLLKNTFVKYPAKISVGGTVSSIRKITKEDLYTCYNTFYNPSNMILVISGNINPDRYIELIKENQNKKEFSKENTIIVKKYDEPDKVAKEKEELKMNVKIPKIALSWKINFDKFKKLKHRDIVTLLGIYLDTKIGNTSDALEKMKKEGVVNLDIDFDYLRTDKHLVLVIETDTEKPEEFSKMIREALEEKTCNEEEFNRKRKMMISKNVYMSDNIFALNSKVLSNLIEDNEVFDYDKEIRNLKFKDFEYLVKNLDLSNTSEVIIRKLK